ncbi:adrenocorticotropic hormone receptor-like [Dendronephthya gigantea]|uniref:adrenocorticotropic hormone receptor-like n=1 Tax=Dendronephthya gigantea TaxID=151771 RepID=UPI00106BE43E|nr:adrenocorticotropic hormone receptor-like [Dendronephthya gigantea]XP_028417503.1 adrenocorticotropic hormone receptor-like [Dendronephthya gigantea]
MDTGKWLNMLALCIVNGCFAVAGIILNSLVILSFWKSTQLRKKLCYFLIFVLACSDLVVVTIIHPLLFFSTIFWYTRGSIIPFIFDPFFGFSMFTLLTMNLERYWAVRHPYFHQRSITKRRLLGLLLIFWSFVVMISVLSHKKIIPRDIPGLAILGVIFLLILYINYQMMATVHAIRQSDALVVRYHTNERQDLNIEIATGENRGNADIKGASTCCIAILCFFVCSFPVLLHNGLWYARKEALSPEIRMPFLLWAETFLSMNSTFNCVIFFYKTTALRREGKKMLGQCCLIVGNVNNNTSV